MRPCATCRPSLGERYVVAHSLADVRDADYADGTLRYAHARAESDFERNMSRFFTRKLDDEGDSLRLVANSVANSQYSAVIHRRWIQRFQALGSCLVLQRPGISVSSPVAPAILHKRRMFSGAGLAVGCRLISFVSLPTFRLFPIALALQVIGIVC